MNILLLTCQNHKSSV